MADEELQLQGWTCWLDTIQQQWSFKDRRWISWSLYGESVSATLAWQACGEICLKCKVWECQDRKISWQLCRTCSVCVWEEWSKHWVEAGRAYERFALKATSLGVKNAFLNMPVEEASVRHAFEGKWAAWSYMWNKVNMLFKWCFVWVMLHFWYSFVGSWQELCPPRGEVW